MQVQASKKYRDRIAGIQSELVAPRKIIGWLIGLVSVNTVMLVYIIWRLNTL